MKVILISLLFGSLLTAQEPPDPQLLIEQLFEQREPKSFEEAYKKAIAGGVPMQTLVEARFLYIVDTGNNTDLAAYVPVLEEQARKFSLDDSIAFAVPEDFLAIVEYAKAIAAFEKDDHSTFKKHITEAFWLSPSQSVIFGKLVNEVRLKDAMEKLKIDMNRTLVSQDPAKPSKPLKEHLGESKVILLHFWSPWARESMESMEDFFLTAKELKKNKISAVSVLLSGAPESRNDGDDFIKQKKTADAASWLVDSPKGAMGSLLRIKALPSVVLLSKEGKVLFNGHPASDNFWRELKNIEAKIEQPSASVREELPTLETE